MIIKNEITEDNSIEEEETWIVGVWKMRTLKLIEQIEAPFVSKSVKSVTHTLAA